MKRILSLVLSFLIIVNMLPMCAWAVNDNSDTTVKQYSAVFQFDDVDSESERHSVTVINDCVYADLYWLAHKLDLKLEINASGNYLSDRFKSSANPVIHKMINGYENVFKGTEENEEYVLSKPNVNLSFYFRSGSSSMYVFSEYMGEISADLGGAVQHLPDENNNNIDTVWIPMSMFLNVFDSSTWIDGTTIHILPCSLTTVDVLHTSNLEKYFYDPVTDGGIDKWISNIKKGYAIFYNKAKKLFQGAVALNPKNVWESLSISDYDDVSNILALQLCTPNASEVDMLKRLSSKTGSMILCDYFTFNLTNDKIDSTNSDLELELSGIDGLFNLLDGLSETVKEGTNIKANDLLSKLSNTTFESTDGIADAVNKSVKAANAANAANKWASRIKLSGQAFNLLAPVFLTYITSANEISSSIQAYNSAVSKYVSEYNNASNIYMKKEIIDVLDKKSQMYAKKNTTVFNSELTENLIESNFWSSVSVIGESNIRDVLKNYDAMHRTGFLGEFDAFFGKLKLISIGWDITEWAINGASGGAFDSLDALNNASIALMLEYDSEQIVHSFKKKCKNIGFTSNDLETYKALELVRLKSYLITREDVLSYYKFWEKKRPEQFPYIEAEIAKDNEDILKYMEALLSVRTGITSEKISVYEKSSHSMDEHIIRSDVLCDNPLQAYAKIADIFTQISGQEFTFMSGAGGWSTELVVQDDGSFSGLYKDYDANYVTYCEFDGKFEVTEKIDDYSYRLKLVQFTKNNSDKPTTDAYGLEGCDDYIIYLPGQQISKLSEDALMWLRWDTSYEGSLEALETYCIYNTLDGYTFKMEQSSDNEYNEYDSEEWYDEEYQDNGQCGANAYWNYNEASNTLIISGEGAIKDFDGTPPWIDCSPEEDDYSINVVIKEGITAIGNRAFNEIAIKSLQLPDTLKKIGNNIFSLSESQIQSLTIPKNVESIGEFGLSGLEVEEFKIASGNKNFSVDDSGVLFNKEKTTLVCYPSERESDSYTIPSKVSTINAGAFAGTKIVKLTVPASVKTIKSDAFYFACDLEELYFQGNAPMIDDYEFSDTYFTLYYPRKYAASWKQYIGENFGGDIQWKEWDG